MRQNPPAARSPLAEDPSHPQEPARSRLGAKVTGHPADLLAVRRKTMDQKCTRRMWKTKKWEDEMIIDIDLQSKYVLLIFTMCQNVSYIRDITWYTFRSSSYIYIYICILYIYILLYTCSMNWAWAVFRRKSWSFCATQDGSSGLVWFWGRGATKENWCFEPAIPQ